MSKKRPKAHGGARANAGRKKKEATKVVSFRVRKSKLKQAEKAVNQLKKELK